MKANNLPKNSLSRNQLRVILHAGMQAKAFRFTRTAAELWLAATPGDIEITAVYAHALIEDNRVDLALPLLKQIAIREPEFTYIHKLLWHTTGDIAFSSSRDAIGILYVLGEIDTPMDEMPLWAAHLREAHTLMGLNIFDRAHKMVQDALSLEPPTPLAAIFDVRIAQGLGDEDLVFTLLESYHGRWPDTIFFTLLLADAWLKRGSESLAVSFLHEAAANDISGQVAEKIWGPKHEYQRLFPSDLGMPFDLQVPAEVSAALGWNQLAVGEISNSKQSSGERPKRSAPVNPESLLQVRAELERIARKLDKAGLANNDSRFPIYVLLSSHEGLEGKYGLQNLPVIDAAIQRVAESTRAWGTWGAKSIYVDSASSTDPFGIPPCRGNDPWAIKQFLADLDHALKARGEMIGAVLIVGGPEVVPFHRLPNPVDDNDPDVLSDNPYSTPDENYFIPLWPVGRIPGGKGNDPKLLMNLLDQITEHRKELQGKRHQQGWLQRLIDRFFNRNAPRPAAGYTAEIWQRASHAVYRPIGKPTQLMISPPTNAGVAAKANHKAVQLSYYNLHGLEDSPEWYGQRDPYYNHKGPDYPIALRPNDIANSGRAPQIVYSEACYGANVIDKGVEDAISLKFLASGTLGVVGSTTTSYGSIAPPLIAADLLGKSFWQLLKEGFPAGEALLRAKINLAREMDKRQGYLDGEDQKTLIQFVLYGDPLAQPHLHGATPKAIQRENGQEYLIETVCDKSDGNAPDPKSIPMEVVTQVKNLLQDQLPGMKNARVGYSREHVGCIDHDCPLPHVHAKSATKLRGARQVVTLTKSIQDGDREHAQYTRITLDKDGKMVKLAVSR